jgi:hypothetical protein
MDDLNGTEERRRFPRMSLDLPIEYRVEGMPRAHGGLTVNASEAGLLIHTVEDLPVGTKLNLLVLFPKEYELSNFAVFAQIVWKDVCWKEDWVGFQYGLEFIELSDEDHWKLRQVLNGQFGMGKVWKGLETDGVNGKEPLIHC